MVGIPTVAAMMLSVTIEAVGTSVTAPVPIGEVPIIPLATKVVLVASICSIVPCPISPRTIKIVEALDLGMPDRDLPDESSGGHPRREDQPDDS
jgi:hypothetical protein